MVYLITVDELMDIPALWWVLVLFSTLAIFQFLFYIFFLRPRIRKSVQEKWQKRLLQSEERMRLAVQNVPVMLDAFNEHGRLVVWNKKCEEVTGYTEEEMLHHDGPYEILYPDKEYRQLLEKKWQNSSNNYDDESVITCKNGEKRTIQWIHRADRHPIPGWSDWGIGIDITDQRQTEMDLKASEQQLSSMIDNLPGMAWRLRIDDDFTVLFVSEGANDLLGVSPEKVLKDNIKPRDIILPEYHDLVRNETIRCVREMVPCELVIPIQVGDKVKWVLDRFKPVQLSPDQIVIDGLLIDISDKLEYEQRLQFAIEGAREGMWDWDIESDILELNSYAAEMLGFGFRRLPNARKEFFELLHKDDAESTKKAFIEHFKGHTDYYEKEYRLKTNDDNWKWIQTRGRVIERNKKGRALRAMGTNIDINARKMAEIALKENEKRLTRLLSNLPGMVYRCNIDKDWSMVFVSEGALELTGYTAEEFTSGQVIFAKVISVRDRDRVWAEVQEALKEEKSFTLSYRIRTRSGKIKWVWERGSLMEGIDLLEGFITDITDRVLAEERIIATVIETEDNERKRISKELHDSLGQKLTTASLNFNALKKNITTDKNGLAKLVNGLNSLNSAIRDSREIAHNLMPRSIENFGYGPSVENMIAEISSGTQVNFEFYENMLGKRLTPTLEVHLYRITQEALNNILKHSNARNVTIQLMKYEEDIVLTIEDDGQGFDKKQVMNGAENFGLKSIRNRVNSLKGNFTIESSPKVGTLITVELPAKLLKL